MKLQMEKPSDWQVAGFWSEGNELWEGPFMLSGRECSQSQMFFATRDLPPRPAGGAVQ